MKFTKDKPEVPGWYWVKFRSDWYEIPSIEMAQVLSYGKKKPDTIKFCNQLFTINEGQFLEFAGPIEVPET
jgi:hypothetical protein